MTKAIRLLSRVLQLLQLRQLQQLRKGIALLAHVCLSMTKATRLLTRVLQLLQLRQLQQLRQSVALLAHFRSITDLSNCAYKYGLAIAAIAAIAESYCTFSAYLISQ